MCLIVYDSPQIFNWVKIRWVFCHSKILTVFSRKNFFINMAGAETCWKFLFPPGNICKRIGSPKRAPKKVFWGGMSYNSPGALVPVEGMMNSDKYTNLLQSRVVPLLSKKFLRCKWKFWQDSAPCVPKKCIKFFREKKVKVLSRKLTWFKPNWEFVGFSFSDLAALHSCFIYLYWSLVWVELNENLKPCFGGKDS